MGINWQVCSIFAALHQNYVLWFGLIGVIKVLEIPKGARHLLIQELNGTANILGNLNRMNLKRTSCRN